ncbi:MAG: DUF1571 domain-containing protein, partial [Planctomycetota bacterium]
FMPATFLAPDSLLAMANARYPITEIGLHTLAKRLIERGSEDLTRDSTRVELTAGHMVGNQRTLLIQVRRATPTGGENDFSLAEIAIDNQTLLPVRYTAYGWDKDRAKGEPEDTPPLLESYTYRDLKVNVGLKDTDFDRENSEYRF